jgi:hypothetical protein
VNCRLDPFTLRHQKNGTKYRYEMVDWAAVIPVSSFSTSTDQHIPHEIDHFSFIVT